MYDSEPRTILGELGTALKILLTHVSLKLHICLEYISIAYNVSFKPKQSSQDIFKRFWDTAKNGLQTRKEKSVK